MALVLKDRVKQAAAAPGTGTITLGATAVGFQSFAAVGDGNTTYFAIVDAVSGSWEVNYGVYTSSGTTLTRNATPLSSSAGGALVNFTNAVDVFLTYPSEKAVWQDVSGLVAQQSFGAITATSAALTTGTITTAPVNNTDIVNKQYADAIASGIHFHEAVNLATTTALPANTYNNGTSGVGATLTANANGALSIDSTLTTASERVLVKNEAAGANNGVYTVTQVGSAGTPYILTRATDFDSVGTGVNEIDEGDFFLVTSGTANVNTAWVQQTPPPITLGTTALVFQQFSAPITYTAGTGLSESPTYTFNIANTGTAGTYGSSSFVPVFVTNAQGQVTSVTNTAIAINGSAVSGNISGSAGSVANALTLGTYLTGGTYNGSGAVTATVDATSANTASKVVARDASGNFAAGTITAALSGNATSATNLAGGAANQIPYQTGSGATTFATAPTTSSTYLYWNGSAFAWGAITSGTVTSITAGAYLTGGTITTSGTIAVDATDANTASKVVARDASGNFSASTITAALTGNATTATTAATANALNTANSYTVAGLTLTTANGYINSNRTSAGSGEIGYTWGSGGVITWYNYLVTNGTTLNWYSSTSATVMSLTTGGALNTVGAITQNGSQVLTAANYNSYAPTLTGTGASGTWGINITGSAGSAPGYLPLSGGTMTGAIVGATNTIIQGTLSGVTYGYLYQSVDGFGLLSNTGNWAVRVNYGTLNTSFFGIAQSNTDMRAPIFYDSDNTGYYVDPAGTSNLAVLKLYGNDNQLQINTVTNGAAAIFFQEAAANKWELYHLQGQFRFYNYTLGQQEAFFDNSSGYFQVRTSVRAPIFYDSDDTAFYVNPNGTSRIRRTDLIASGSGWDDGLNLYSSDQSNRWNFLVDDGASDMLRIAYNNSERLQFATGGAITAIGDFRAPIFYDSNNTAYYVDPASTSYIATLILSGASYFRPNNWIQLDGDYGIYNTVYNGAHFLANASSSYGAWRMIGSRNSYSGIYDTYSGVVANMYDSSGNGGIYREANGRWYQYYLLSNDCTGFGTSTTNSAYNIYCPKGIYSGGRVDGTIFYDTNNTGYYLDMNGSSNVSTIVTGSMYFMSNFNTASGSSAPLQAYSSGGSGAVMSFHRGGYYAVNMGLDSDSVFRIGGWSAPANLWQLDMAGNGYYLTSSRAPIFYDVNNTAYYVDPASTSNLSDVQAVYLESSNSIEMRSSVSGTYPAFLVNQYADVTIYRGNGTTAYIGFSNDNVAYLYNDGTNFIFSGRGLQATSFGVGTAPSGTTGEIRATNNITAYYSSDIKFKTNVRDIPNAIETVESIGGKLFDWNDEYIEEHGGEDGYFIQKEDFGVIAQDVQAVFPVAVRTRPDGSLAVDYEKLSALAFAAVAELSTRVKSLEARI